jgi:hypothetical protein
MQHDNATVAVDVVVVYQLTESSVVTCVKVYGIDIGGI